MGINAQRAMTWPTFKLLHSAMQEQAEIGCILYTTSALGVTDHFKTSQSGSNQNQPL